MKQLRVTIDNLDGSYKTLEDNDIKFHISQYSGFPAYEFAIPSGSVSLEISQPNSKEMHVHFFTKDVLIDNL